MELILDFLAEYIIGFPGIFILNLFKSKKLSYNEFNKASVAITGILFWVSVISIIALLSR
jgi:hypothetical protein